MPQLLVAVFMGMPQISALLIRLGSVSADAVCGSFMVTHVREPWTRIVVDTSWAERSVYDPSTRFIDHSRNYRGLDSGTQYDQCHHREETLSEAACD